jgi:hypothetical protein
MMMNRQSVSRICIAALFLLPVFAGAQDAEETAAYQAWHAANAAKEIPKGYELAKQYVQKYPKGQYAEFLGKWIASARGALFNEALKAKDTKTMLALGQERLAEDPGDLNYLLALALNLRRNALFASPADYTHAAEIDTISRSTIAQIEAGKTPAGVDAAKWNKNDALAWLHQNVALIAVKQKQEDEALQRLEQSSKLDPDNASLTAYNAFVCGTLRKERYDGAVARFQALPEAERSGSEPSAAAKAAIDAANQEADATLDCWAKFLALAEGQAAFAEVKPRIEKAAGDLWKYRHPDDPEGLSKLIAAKRAEGPQD